MATSDEEGELVPNVVSNYYFVDDKDVPVSFGELPVQWNDEVPDCVKKQIFFHGTTDNGLQTLYKKVTAWKFDLEEANPSISVLSKENNWIKLQKPRKSYEVVVRTILITVHGLHFLRKDPEATARALWDCLTKSFSSYDVIPSKNDLMEHMEFVRAAVKKDGVLAKSKFLGTFLEEMPGIRKALEKDAIAITKPAFIVDDVIVESEDDVLTEGAEDNESDEEGEIFDSVCAICDNGGNLLCCEGKCLRSFHATLEDGSDSTCESLGLSNEQVEEIQTFFCKNCQYNKHQCFACGELGPSDKSSGAEVFRCSNATCGRFYHPHCVAKLTHHDNEAEAEDLREKIASGELFACPAHKCAVCKQLEDEKDHELQFAICRRCPKSYHRKCLPRKIIFEDSEDGNVLQRAWEGLLPKSRILIYCLKHAIDDEIQTPKRDHIKFTIIGQKKKKASELPLSGGKAAVSDRHPGKKSIVQLAKGVEKLPSAAKQADSSKKRAGLLSGAQLSKKQKVADAPVKALGKTSSAKVTKSTVNEGKRFLGDRLFALMSKESEPIKTKKEDIVVKPLSKDAWSLPPLDADEKKKLLAVMKEANSSMSLEEITERYSALIASTHSSRSGLDKNITLGKVEGTIEALRLALKKLEEGCSIEDAQAVCDPGVLNLILKWKNKLRVYLAPFLYGMRYTSFGRHFTKVEKLKEIVDMLHWYVQDGDTVVDFCCGANDFSCLVKEKLDEMGKKCEYRNYDLIQAKNDFNFEKRDWMTVRPKELPPGSQLIMGLNPPFGVKASLANKFIDKALTFKPKLIVLIVPPETERIDKKKPPYDLIWEDDELLAGKSFYLPGSVDAYDKQVSQWNITPPPLYLWSRADWTAKHMAIAQQHGHCSRVHESSCSTAVERDAFDIPIEECYDHINEASLPVDGSHAAVIEPKLVPEIVASVISDIQKEAYTDDNDKAAGGEYHGNGKKSIGSGENSKKSGSGKKPKKKNRVGKKNQGKGWPHKTTPEDSWKVLDSQPSRADVERESNQQFERNGTGLHLHHEAGYGGTHGMTWAEDMVRKYGKAGEPYSIPTFRPGYGTWEREVQFPTHPREGLRELGYSMDGRNYGVGQQDILRSSSSYLPGHTEVGFRAPYGQLGSTVDNRASGSAMSRYAPRLDELNPARVNGLSGPAIPNRSSVYNRPPPPMPRPGLRVGPLGFAPGPYRPFSQQNSSGWLNE